MCHLFLLAITTSLRLAANLKLEFLTFGDVSGVITETIEELTLNHRFRFVLL